MDLAVNKDEWRIFRAGRFAARLKTAFLKFSDRF
jgi:hypothetical protein